MESKLLDIHLGDDFFEFDTTSKRTKRKNKRVGLHQTEKPHSKENQQQNEKLWNGRKCFQTLYLIKGFISKKYKELIQLSSRTEQTPSNAITKWTRDQNKHFSKEDMQIANK